VDEGAEPVAARLHIAAGLPVFLEGRVGWRGLSGRVECRDRCPQSTADRTTFREPSVGRGPGDGRSRQEGLRPSSPRGATLVDRQFTPNGRLVQTANA